MSSPLHDPAAPPGLRTDAEARRAGDPADELLADTGEGAVGAGTAPDAPESPERLAEREHRPVLVVDFGAQYAQLIARRVREAQGLLRDRARTTCPVERMLERDPAAVILSGGPARCTPRTRRRSIPRCSRPGVPVLGICYGFQAMARALGGEVDHTGLREYGGTTVDGRPEESVLLHGQPDRAVGVDEPRRQRPAAPEGFQVVAEHVRDAGRAFEDRRPQAVRRAVAPRGRALDVRPAGARELPDPRRRDRRRLDDRRASSTSRSSGSGRRSATARVICGLSGGVDSAVAAALVQRAVGDQLTCVFVDHGLLRAGEARAGRARLRRGDRRPAQGRGRGGPVPRRARGRRRSGGEAEDHRPRVHPRLRAGRPRGRRRGGRRAARRCEFLVQGTLYPDVVESGGGTGTANIKSHHNVGGPARRPAVRRSSSRCGRCSRTRCAPSASSWACPRRSCAGSRSRGPGWASGSSGRSPPDRLETLRAADAIVREELTAAGLDREIWQCPVVLLADVRSRRRAGRRAHLRSPDRAAARSRARTP